VNVNVNVNERGVVRIGVVGLRVSAIIKRVERWNDMEKKKKKNWYQSPTLL